MGKNIHTLTAYKCSFKYMERNNPLKVELSEAIKNEETPEVSLDVFLTDYISKGKKFIYGENTDRVVRLDKIESTENVSGYTRHFLVPKAGRQGAPITLINTKDLEKTDYDFGDDWSATYNHNIFAYQFDTNKNGEFVMIFHRYGGSGCKSVFYETANKALKEKGIRLNMEWVIPYNSNSGNKIDIVPTKINLIYQKDVNSTDITDYVRGKKQNKKITIKELSLNLTAKENNGIVSIFRNLSLNKITKDEALASIQSETSPEYNTAKVAVMIGKTPRMVSWEDFENLYDGFDITEKMNRMKGSFGFVEALMKCSDEYFLSVFRDSEDE